VFVKPIAFILTLICAWVMWAEPSLAQQGATHSVGEGALSADGRYLALTLEGAPINSFVVVQVDTGRSFVFTLPASEMEVADLAWGTNASSLVFVSKATKRIPRDQWRVDNGMEMSIWMIAFTPAGPQPAQRIERGEHLELPALSLDGSRLAWFQPVARPEDKPPKLISTLRTVGAFGVYEKDLATGLVERVSDAQYNGLHRLFYADKDTWLLGVDDVLYLRNNTGWFSSGTLWAKAETVGPPEAGMTGLMVRYGAFRMARGEPSASKDKRSHPYPDEGVAPIESRLSGVTSDGFPILHGAPGPENTARNREINAANAYGLGGKRIEFRDGFLAYGPDGLRRSYFMPARPHGYHGLPGGQGVDAEITRAFDTGIGATPGNTTEQRFEASKLWVYQGQALLRETTFQQIVANADRIQIAD
jgi:hypothetical protein